METTQTEHSQLVSIEVSLISIYMCITKAANLMANLTSQLYGDFQQILIPIHHCHSKITQVLVNIWQGPVTSPSKSRLMNCWYIVVYTHRLLIYSQSFWVVVINWNGVQKWQILVDQVTHVYSKDLYSFYHSFAPHVASH